jgi:CheY-like chemotaxis protein
MARILIVEDEEMIRTLSTQLLELMGHAVDGVGSGEQAVIRLRLRRYDVVLSDLDLPGMNGWAVARLVKQVSPQSKVGLVSGWEIPPEDEELQAGNVDFCLTKPFDLDQMQGMLDQVLSEGSAAR